MYRPICPVCKSRLIRGVNRRSYWFCHGRDFKCQFNRALTANDKAMMVATAVGDDPEYFDYPEEELD